MMFEFLNEQRQKGVVTNEMLDLYNGVFITQVQYDELKAIEVSTK